MQSRFDLTPKTTFQTRSVAEHFECVASLEELKKALARAREKGLEVHLIGGGANTLARSFVPGLVIEMGIKGFEVRATEEGVKVDLGAGEVIDSVIERLVDRGLGGIENLSAIPGTVGGAVVQNIGAYGCEIGPFVESVRVYDPEADAVRTLSNAECRFAYRHSVFKEPEGRGLVILGVTLDMGDPEAWRPTTSYKAVEEVLRRDDVRASTLTPSDMRRIVIDIRRERIPDPARIGNAGSFFTNPIVPTAVWREVIEAHPTLVWYTIDETRAKLGAGSLIDQAGLKGYCGERVGVHPDNALILVNLGEATGEDVLALKDMIVSRVEELYGVKLEMEPVVI